MSAYAIRDEMTDNLESTHRRTPAASGLIGGLLLGSVLAGMGGFFVFALLAFGYFKAAEMQNWIETPCKILKAAVVTTRATPNSPGLSLTSWTSCSSTRLTVWTHQSTNYRKIAQRSAHRSRIQKIVDRLPAGTTTVCFVKPGDPTTAVLKKDTRAVGYTIWFPGLFVIGGIGIMAASVRNWLKERRASQP